MRRKPVAWGTLLLAIAASAVHASTVIGLSVEDQARLAGIVVVGEVIGQRGVDNPGSGIETAVTLKVSEVLKGNVRPGQALVFHTRGGQVGPEISEALGEAVVQSGQRVLVFIESIDGRLYNMGLSMGVWDVHEDTAGAVSYTRAVRDGLTVVGDAMVEPGPISDQDMRERVGYAKRNPRLDNELLRGSTVGQGR